MPQVDNITALELCDAATHGSVDRVESLLASGVDPNVGFDELASALPGVADDWATVEKSTCPPILFFDHTEAPALRRAAQDGNSKTIKNRGRAAQIMTTLLQHGADPYALFRQPIQIHHGRPLYPGDTEDKGFSDEETDLMMVTVNHTEILRKALELEELRQQGISEPECDDSDYESDCEYDMALAYQPQYPRKYGVCSTLHSLLELGKPVRPVLDFLGDKLDLERRDPQGRTLFLAACRSPLGLDASIDGDFHALSQDSTYRGLRENPYPQPNNPWRQSETQGYTLVLPGPTLLEFFISHGANLLAVDNYGRNALHQLFISFHREAEVQPAIIEAGLKYLLANCPSLVNQADYAGFYPLHLAIRRMGVYMKAEDTLVPTAIYKLETAVDDLLAGGADPLARDSRGNTVLHYLAACKLGENDKIGMGNEQRRLLRVFLSRGVDPKVRNQDGHSALELFFRTGPVPMIKEAACYDAVGEEVIGVFEQAGCDLMETTPDGQMLLHLVAGLVSVRAFPWFKILQGKGLGPMARDKEGNTPIDIAMGNEKLAKHLRKERAEI
ncbi:hypothetical protein PENSOL_c004G08699 [Penicillium solitum]|uniref:Uncharacterized protein n=1 Tax=Penicillium solitum TaxID=60172 RepID=A0A1V6RIG6_9EURO|nr:uncharacterized protein PENSOL_c004G08699 [Penicillium solitum]OQE01298.1 hypothetical protein PENSOL_c004G08699 [Penicillium solitum]